MSRDRTLLTINTGSSSLKTSVYPLDYPVGPLIRATVSRIGLPGGRMRIEGRKGAALFDTETDFADHAAAVGTVLDWLRRHGQEGELRAVGHRVVHGGGHYLEPQRIDATLIDTIEELVPLDPDHLPQALTAIEEIGRAYPDLSQVACFDSAFHRHMPKVAQLYPLPLRLAGEGVIRYGFHGLSCEYILQELQRIDPAAADGRLVIAHLGNGASMTAVRNGISIDTTMGLTPAGGLMMGTRSGDLDPGVLLHLLQRGMSVESLSDLMNRQAGLLAVSGQSPDMRDLLKCEAADAAVALAIDLFCYQARKYLGALVAALGGLETLVFTGGIGENAPIIRQRICDGFDFIGIRLDAHTNERNEPIISRDTSSVVVRVMKTDEDLMIARHTREVIREGG